MNWITDNIAVGDIDDAVRLDKLREAGISTILGLNGFPSFPVSSRFAWFHVPLKDGPGNDPCVLQEALNILHHAVSVGQRILVHCAEGASRAPFVVACYLESHESLSFDEALQLIARERPYTSIDPALLLLRECLLGKHPKD